MNLEALIEKIKVLDLDNSQEAFKLYTLLCECLKEKYGLLDRDYDENPKKRGKEWIDIHHILEYKLADIANATENAKHFEKFVHNQTEDKIVVVKSEVFKDETAMENIRKLHPNASIYELDYSLEELKPYNLKVQLVYANKIEHFLLHYLIELVRGKKILSRGLNYLWDCCVALDLYGFDEEYMNNLKKQKDTFYSQVSSEEITRLYKKLIDWKNCDIERCSKYWNNFRNVIKLLNEKEISYIEDKEKFFNLFGLLGYHFKKDTINAINNFEYKVKTFTARDGNIYKEINGNIFKTDGKTVVLFDIMFERKSFTIPFYVEGIATGAFDRAFHLETVTIPITVNYIEDTAFIEHKIKVQRSASINKIIYKGTKEEWDNKFSNVKLTGITLVCKKR